MARLPYLDPEDLAPSDRDLMQRTIALNRILAHSPGAMRPFQQFANWIRFKCTLDPRLRELAILQVGWVAKSPYEWSHHVKIGYDFGVTDDDIRALIADSRGEKTDLGEIERAVLGAAREMAQEVRLSDATFATLKKHLSNENIVDLLLIVSEYCGVVRFLAAMQVDVEPDYQPHLDDFPLED
jgi:alkylhydroperoxidase family enzyme